MLNPTNFVFTCLLLTFGYDFVITLATQIKELIES